VRLALAAAAAALLVLAPAPARAQMHWAHDAWTIEQGLPENSITSVTQTRDGYLWLGTYEGLVRFDGVQFQVFDKTNTPALANNTIYKLLEARDGTLWIATNGGGLVRYANGRFSALRVADGTGLRSDVVRVVYQDKDGLLWVGTDLGLHAFKDGRFQSWGAADGLGHDAVRSIVQSRDGSLWVGTAGGGLVHKSGDTFRRWTTATGLTHDIVRTVFEDRRGRLWLGGGGGLTLFEGGQFTHYGVRDGLSHAIVTSIYEDRDGTLWVCTNGGGVTLLRDGRLEPLRVPGLGDLIVYTVAEDREGSVWIGTYVRGLHRLRRTAISGIGTAEGLPHDLVKTVHEGPDGSIWVATNGGGLARLRNGHFEAYSTKDGLSSDIVIAVHADEDGDVWAGTYLQGLNRLRPDRTVRVYTTRDGLGNNHVTAIHRDRQGALWAGTYGGGLSALRGEAFETLTTRDGLSSDVVRTLLEARDGTLYVGTNEGLDAVRDGRVAKVPGAEALATAVMTLHEDDTGALWIGSRGRGLGRLSGGTLRWVTTREGLFNDVVYRLLDDERGSYWMSCDKGVFRVRRRELEDYMAGRVATVAAVSYGRGDGMPSPQTTGGFHPAGWRSRDGRLWFPTIAGLAVVDPGHIQHNNVPPPVVVEQLVANDEPVLLSDEVVLEPGRNKLELHYTGLSFLVPHGVRFRYRLEGFDTDWVDAGTRRIAYYTNLPPGRYVFHVTAGNSDGVWNTGGAAVRLRLRPHAHQTIAFYTACGAVLALAGFGLYRLRVSQLRSRARELALLVEQRTRSLAEERDNAERARGELARVNAQLESTNLALHEANQVRNELLQIAAHDLRNPLQAVLGCAESIIEQPTPDPATGAKASLIYRASRRMLSLVNQLVETSALDSAELQLQLAPVDAVEAVDAVVAANRQLAEQKGQRLLLASEGDCRVQADAERLREVVDNLVSNAIKYSPSGSEVDVRVRRQDGHVRVEVADQGPGLSADDLPRLFGRFQRLSARPTAGETSTGLGLSIVKRLVDLHEGRVWAESAGPGQGTRFVVELKALAGVASREREGG
jgi:ligand-binding sensor domain-containing protein/signal transduction histidine kinase